MGEANYFLVGNHLSQILAWGTLRQSPFVILFDLAQYRVAVAV
jgi:hypothetical protein